MTIWTRVVDPLGEVGDAERGAVEQLEPQTAPLGQAEAGQRQADIGYPVGRYAHRGAVGAQPVRHALLAKLLNDGGRILAGKVGVDRRIPLGRLHNQE
jgi:hypothetical protein